MKLHVVVLLGILILSIGSRTEAKCTASQVASCNSSCTDPNTRDYVYPSQLRMMCFVSVCLKYRRKGME
ncbi:hypothetical protein EB796_022645 [Bugula neritina]|uniref:Uncharacterized protein n=1 Tax=Bugula neritina TaxID=10212 RepID=A0A7J7J078_BUGNE|nr:hypothetical protein EB796_022645 [Bugula neritina]